MRWWLILLLLLPGLARANPCGDVNGDGVVNVGDALLAAQYDVGNVGCGQGNFKRPSLCDVNSDSACNIGDALRMAQCDVGLIPCTFTCGTYNCPALYTPTGLLVVSATSTSVSLTWNPVSFSIHSYKLYRGTDPSHTTFRAEILAPTTTYTDTGLTPGNRYYYRLTAVDTASPAHESAQSAATTGTATPTCIVTETPDPVLTFTDADGIPDGAEQGNITVSWSGPCVLPMTLRVWYADCEDNFGNPPDPTAVCGSCGNRRSTCGGRSCDQSLAAPPCGGTLYSGCTASAMTFTCNCSSHTWMAVPSLSISDPYGSEAGFCMRLQATDANGSKSNVVEFTFFAQECRRGQACPDGAR